MALVLYQPHPDGRRCFIAGRYRFHHFTAGLALIAAGLALCWHDRRDWRRALPDLIRDRPFAEGG